MAAFNVYRAKAGDRFTKDGDTFTVLSVAPAGTYGTAASAGPRVTGTLHGPGSYAVTIDATTPGVEVTR